MQSLEIEWQFDAPDLDVVARWARTVPVTVWQLGNETARQQTDTYFDTADWRFFRAGFALRLRVCGNRMEATLKSFGTALGDRRDRVEISETLTATPQERRPSLLKRMPGAVGERVRAVTGKTRLRALFDVITHRRTFDIAVGAASAELALDQTRVRAGRSHSAVRLSRVELEVEPTALELLEPVAAAMRSACHLEAAQRSKYEVGIHVGRFKPGLALDLGEPCGTADLTDSVSHGDLAYAVMREQFRALFGSEPAVRLGDDAEAVHEMRVAVRRLRAAMRLFSAALPTDSASLRTDMRWLGLRLGRVRDLDVELAQLRVWGESAGSDTRSYGAVAGLLRERRRVHRRQLLRALDSARYARLLQHFGTLLRRGPPATRNARDPARDSLPRAIVRQHRKLRGLGDALTPEMSPAALHALRIAGKRLRYALEFAAPLLGDRAAEFIARLIALQDTLGAHQDAQIAQHELCELAASAPTSASRSTRRALQSLSRRYQLECSRHRALVPEQYRRLRGKCWRAARHGLEN